MFFKLLLLPLSTNQIILPLTLNFNDVAEVTSVREKEAGSANIDKQYIDTILDRNNPAYLIGVQSRFKTGALKTNLNVDMSCIIVDDGGSKLSDLDEVEVIGIQYLLNYEQTEKLAKTGKYFDTDVKEKIRINPEFLKSLIKKEVYINFQTQEYGMKYALNMDVDFVINTLLSQENS